jgi:bacteriocin-like protein
MKKSILNLQGAQELTKNQLKSINGGAEYCNYEYPCQREGTCCKGNHHGGQCRPISEPGGYCMQQYEPIFD